MSKASIIRIRALLTLVFLLITWLLISESNNANSEDQAKLLTNHSIMSDVNKSTGLPNPGTYKLEKIFKVPAQSVLDSNSKLQPIGKYTKGKITLLTFFYERCSDAKGCPYAMGVFHAVKNELEKNNKANNLVRLVHISFDPLRDTPVMMKGLEKQMKASTGNNIEWDFLTTPSVNDLLPIIDGFGQNVDINIDSNLGNKILKYQHVLKVFLIDNDGVVREIYSTAYLSKNVLLNDIKTLLQENNIYI